MAKKLGKLKGADSKPVSAEQMEISRLISRVLIKGSKGPGHPDHGSQFPRRLTHGVSLSLLNANRAKNKEVVGPANFSFA